MPEEGEEWKEETNRFFPNEFVSFVSGFPVEAILNEKREVVPVRSVTEWGKFMETVENRRVAETTLNGFWVSTVFLGINHDYTGTGPGLWFETMVFPDKENPSPPEVGEKIRRYLEGIQLRYVTWAEAEAGHAAIVETIRCGLF